MNYEPIPGVPPSRNPTHRRFRDEDQHGPWAFHPLPSQAFRFVDASTPTWRRKRQSSKRLAHQAKRR